LQAQPEVLVCYDLVKHPAVERLRALAGPTRLVFHEQDVRQADLEPTDLLFIDTDHVYEQLRLELARHAGKVHKYIAVHGTTTFADEGESPGQGGLWHALEEFLAQGTFRLQARYDHGQGLTVMKAVSAPGSQGDSKANPAGDCPAAYARSFSTTLPSRKS
jgi:hypothetical protein